MDLAWAQRMFGGLPTVFVATIGPDGGPHVVPLWFVWPEDAVFVSTRRGSRTFANASSDRRVSLSLDVGRGWTELAGIVVQGKADRLFASDPTLRRPMSVWHEKYRSLLSGEGFARFTEEVAELAFLRVVPERLIAWDHARS